MNKGLKVAGRVIGELSEKIPSPIIAFNELIKNSYDAGAKSVLVSLDSNRGKLIFSDNGEGMDENDIDVLFQIAKSTKKYGEMNPKTGRYIQGSKGLGFLSVFKFGDIVKWTTSKDKKRTFCINYKDVLELDDITEYIVSISEENATQNDIGTEIEIELRNDYNTAYLKEYLLNQIYRDKILNSFIDKQFVISLDIDGDLFQTKEDKTLDNYYAANQFFKVLFSSSTKEINIVYKQLPRFGPSTTSDMIVPFDHGFNDRYELSLELMIFDFYRSRRRNDPDKLFIINDTKLTPLIFINKNLFNNFSLFDPESLRYSSSGISLPQMIGYVEIISSDKDIQFNSDRTQFQENELTASIRKVLEDLNKQIQLSCSEIKDELKNKDNAETQKDSDEADEGAGDKANDKSKKNKEEQKNENKETATEQLRPVVLKVKDEENLITPTGQINLRDYILKAEDSLGNSISIDEILITIGEESIPQGIMESVRDACRKVVMYTYNDPRTGKHDSSMVLTIQSDSLGTLGIKRVLIPNKAVNSYTITFQNNPIDKLLPQIEKLYSQHKDSYNEVIACSLRALFELSIYELEMSGLVSFEKARGYRGDKLSAKVTTLVSSIISNSKLVGWIVSGLGRSGDYQQFINELSTIDFKTVVKKCHLGAHRSTSSVFDDDIRSIGNSAGLFLVIVNELLNNQDIKWATIGQPWHIVYN